jgi:hypothetical protein
MFTVLDVVTLECAYWSVADARLACATPEKFKVFELGGLAWRQVMTLGLSRQSGVPLCWSCQYKCYEVTTSIIFSSCANLSICDALQ